MTQITNPRVAEARRLLAAGAAADARKLLLAEGFVERLDASAQAAFRELIPPRPELERALEELLKPLAAPEGEARRSAIKRVAREVSRSWHKDVAAWADDPRSVDLLLPLAADPDPKTVQFAASALVRVFERYLADRRIPDALMPTLQARSPEARAFAAVGVLLGGDDERWSSVSPLLRDPSAVVRAEVLRLIKRCGAARLPRAQREAMRPMVEAALDDRDPEVLSAALNAAGVVGDAATARLLAAKRPALSAPVMLESLDMAIAAITQG